MHHYRYATDPTYQQLTDALEDYIYRNTLNGQTFTGRQVNTIPVVVHVMHLPDDAEPAYGTSNPTDFQIRRALEWINYAFRDSAFYEGGPYYSNAVDHAYNDDGTRVDLGVDTYIQFQLATSDPDSQKTNGIRRYATNLSNFEYEGYCTDANGLSQEQEYCLKSNSWDSEKYFNIWLVNSICQLAGENCNTEGFAYGGSMSGLPLDGMVLQTQYWDTTSYKVSKAVHNIGHYLGLFDTYLNGCEETISDTSANNSCLILGDKVCDTPPDMLPGGGSCFPEVRVNSCTNDALREGSKYDIDVEDLFENYMDTGDPRCKNSFTEGQRQRMIATLNASRSKLLSSSGLKNFVTDLGISLVNSPGPVLCGNTLSAQINLKNRGTRSIRQFKVELYIDGQFESVKEWTGSLAPGNVYNLIFPPKQGLSFGVHSYRFVLVEINNRKEDENTNNNIRQNQFVNVNPIMVQSRFPFCTDFDAGFPFNWATGDLDGVLNFETFDNFTSCMDNHGENYLMYASSSRWDNGLGVGAGANGTRDLLISPLLDFSQENNAVLTFDVAHKLLTPDKALDLKIYVLPDCDGLPQQVFQKSGTDLETSSTPADPSIIGWKPEDCSDWKTFKVPLGNYAGTQFRVLFVVTLNSNYSQNFYLDNICFDTREVCELPTIIPTIPGEYRPDFFCTDSLGWTHYMKLKDGSQTPEDLLLFSVKPANLSSQVDIPLSEAKLTITDRRGLQGHDMQGSAPYAENLKGWHAMSRYMTISKDAQPSDSMLVRFYFDQRDVEDMREAISPETMNEVENLIFYTITSDGDMALANGHESFTSSDYTEFRNEALDPEKGWKLEELDNYYASTVKVNKVFALGGGTGGYGNSYGASYPVMPKYLDAIQNGAAMTVAWETQIEYLTDQFEVYYARDSVNFRLLETVPAQQAPHVYSINHDELQRGDYQYFVKILHKDGLELISDTVNSFYDPSLLVKVYPNPAGNTISVKVNTEIGTDISFGIYDGAGYRKLLAYKWTALDDNAVELDISSLPNGIFFCVIRFGEIEHRVKLVKLD
ncbi:MAG: M43 family zinc metalloprotease [Bacteroidota bacterium]